MCIYIYYIIIYLTDKKTQRFSKKSSHLWGCWDVYALVVEIWFIILLPNKNQNPKFSNKNTTTTDPWTSNQTKKDDDDHDKNDRPTVISGSICPTCRIGLNQHLSCLSWYRGRIWRRGSDSEFTGIFCKIWSVKTPPLKFHGPGTEPQEI